VPGRTHIYRVTAVNTVGLQSKRSADSRRCRRDSLIYRIGLADLNIARETNETFYFSREM